MNQVQIQLVQSSWSDVISGNESAGEYFYEILFTLDPSLKSLFNEDIKTQARKFVSMITFISFKLNDFEAVLAEAKALGKRHKHYSVDPKSYDVVEKALITALSQSLKENWTKETEAAWLWVYGQLRDTMIEAAN